MMIDREPAGCRPHQVKVHDLISVIAYVYLLTALGRLFVANGKA